MMPKTTVTLIALFVTTLSQSTSETTCQIQDQRGFLKYVCKNGTSTYNKCHDSEETYYSEFPLREVCSNDPFFYQACDKAIGGRITNDKFLCEYFVCKIFPGDYVYFSNLLEGYGWICDGYVDCDSGIDETNCPNTTTIMPSGEVIFSPYICNDVCDHMYCEDEALCNGYTYGMYCNVTDNEGNTVYKYISPGWICNGYQECDNGEDEYNCQVTNKTLDTCQHADTGPLVPVFNFTRCYVLQVFTHTYLHNLCADVVQSNCTDHSKIGIICEINGYISTVSKIMINCNKFDLKVCDDGIEQMCKQLTEPCFLHKHFMCDGQFHCENKADERHPHCQSVTQGTCKRRVGDLGNLMIPLAWLGDGIQDCVDGSDEAAIWPTCGVGKSYRLVSSEEACENVFVCRWGNPGYVEVKNLCDGIETCGNENEICSYSRNSMETTRPLPTSDKGLTKRISYCLKGLMQIEMQRGKCTSQQFIFPDHEFFGVDTTTTLHLPSIKQDCSNIFGEQYVYTSCVDKCSSSPCPLREIPRYEVCPAQYPDRVGTIANEEYLAFFTKTHGEVFTNRYFVCDDKISCVDYSQVCDLVKDCGDGSDEKRCDNHFTCLSTSRLIPKVKVCDGSLNCMDGSDECNDLCSKHILQNGSLKGLSWLIGSLAIFANSVIVTKNLLTLTRCQTSVALMNKSLVILISFGDFLIGCYLIVIAIYDSIIFKKDYCLRQITWITSIECSVIGIFSTIGSQISLFSMTVLSTVRIYGIWNSMRVPGEVTRLKAVQVTTGIFSLALASAAIAIIPVIDQFEDFFVNGLKFDEQLSFFIGTPDKKLILDVLEAYYGRMKAATLSWDTIRQMVSGMYSHDLDYHDHTLKQTKVDFYGSDGVCLFKYFVKSNDPQKIFVWGILILNFLCFMIITLSYILIGLVSLRSSKSLTNLQGNRQISNRNRRMNQKIAIIIGTDFACWVPFIIICILHSLEVLDATPWYSLFSMLILPINSVINPFLYDDIVTSFFINSMRRFTARMLDSTIVQSIRDRFMSDQVETIELEEVRTQREDLVQDLPSGHGVVRGIQNEQDLVSETAEEKLVVQEASDKQGRDKRKSRYVRDRDFSHFLRQCEKETADEQIVVQEIADEKGVVQETADKQTIVQETADEQLVVQETADEQIVVQEIADEKGVFQETADKQTVVQETADEQLVVQETADEQIVVQEIADEQGVVQETADEQIVVQETTDEKGVVQETADKQTVVQETADEQLVVQETADDKGVVQETADKQTAVQETADEQIVVQETADEHLVVQETADKQIFVQETADEQIVVQETVVVLLNVP
ncbi:uncharacterized protein LOC134821010 [Bolinopsis microptera]|uniref:uncharacterized protein LOC134821010 n=1 Tax=Bolinopsis microptera TaxID=2820187 RepID=UPI003078EEC7